MKGEVNMSNNLHKVEKDLRSIAKRYKSIKYSIGLAILFLMLGVGAFSEEVDSSQANGVPTREEIASSKENLKILLVVYNQKLIVQEQKMKKV